MPPTNSSVQQALDAIKSARDNRDHRSARSLAESLLKEPRLSAADRLTAVHHLSFCTYKDASLPRVTRLRKALGLLAEADDPERSESAETLGQAGAIHKRLWEATGNVADLQRSFRYYNRGGEVAKEDAWYPRINAAFVLDVLADLDVQATREAGLASPSAAAWRAEAARLRQAVIEELEAAKPSWWSIATLIEAHIGLGNYDAAYALCAPAKALSPKPEEKESTARQLAQLARLKLNESGDAEGFADSPIARIIQELFDIQPAAVESVWRGKLGLALSGGGFRASLFHVGVLAHMAELDLLRHVEVLSCVSGGSIVGALYYLELRRELNRTPEAQMTQAKYVAIVERVRVALTAATQANLRWRIWSNIVTNFRMLLPSYSRTHRVGELLESLLYSKVEDGEQNQPRFISGLFVKPAGHDAFNPRLDNWKRSAKVPMLVLNATTLNTGHNWQFTASWMGEPPADQDRTVDTNYRLRRMYYDRDNIPAAYQKFRLGYAVAASAAVPGIFPPLPMPSLYPGLTVRLADGGVHDNQGVASLIEQDCAAVVVSDASGQMASADNPASNVFGVSLRANSVLMARVRESQFQILAARKDARIVRDFAFPHLRSELTVPQKSWIGSTEPEPPVNRDRVTSYHIREDLQLALARVRTDLDIFAPLESDLLMLSGYQLARFKLAELAKAWGAHDQPTTWPFLAHQEMARAANRLQVAAPLRFLEIGRSRLFRVAQYFAPPFSHAVLKIGFSVGAAVAAFFILRSLPWPQTSFIVGMAIAALVIVPPLAIAFGTNTIDRLYRVIGRTR